MSKGRYESGALEAAAAEVRRLGSLIDSIGAEKAALEVELALTGKALSVAHMRFIHAKDLLYEAADPERFK